MGIPEEEVFAAWSTYQQTKQKSCPISFWAIHNTPNQSYGELEIHNIAETKTYKKTQFAKTPQNQFTITALEINPW